MAISALVVIVPYFILAIILPIFDEPIPDPLFFTEVYVSGLLSGVMYALVALGFVLIFKASGVFNFAQGAMVLFAALTFVRLLEMDVHFWLAVAITLVVMMVLAVVIERMMLRPLVNQPLIILFMATIGLNYFLEGLAQGVWDAQVHGLDLGIPDVPWEQVAEATGLFISVFDVAAAVICGLLVLTLALFFQRGRIGRALRAVADDHQAALSVGIPLQHIWTIVWATAGIVALVAGALWGQRLGVQFSISLIALKALPVLIIGGFNSIAGAIIGGLIIGAGEKLAEVYLGPVIGGGIESWFAYLIAMVFLLFRPHGLFGEEIIERV
ncbi:MAG: branched-chain amino acid ABC transporter permease [Kiloniellales bacterium]